MAYIPLGPPPGSGPKATGGGYQSLMGLQAKPFTPGQYNQQNINLNQFKDPVSLHNAFKSGQINKQQFQTRLFQIQSPKAGNSNLSLGKAITQTAAGVPAGAANYVKQQAQSIGQAAHTVYTADISNPARLAAAEISHNPTALANVGKSIQANPIHKIVGAGLQIAPLLVPGGKAAESLAAGGLKLGLKEALTKAATTGVKQIPAGLAYGAGSGIAAGQKPGQIVKGALEAGGATAVLGAGGSLLGNALKKAAAPLPTPKSAFDNHIVESPTLSEGKPPVKAPAKGVTPVEGATATAGKGTPAENSPIKATPNEPGAKVSGSALRTEQKAVESGMNGELSGKATYSTVSHKAEAANAVQLLHENPTQAMDIAMGKTAGNNASHEAAVYHAVANDALTQAKKTGDYSTVTQLASSPRHTGVSEAAQKLSAEGFNVPAHDPIRIMNDVSATRQKALSGKGANVGTEAANISKQVKSSVPVTSRQDWHSFVESLKC